MDDEMAPRLTRRSLIQLGGGALVLPAVPVSAHSLDERRPADEAASASDGKASVEFRVAAPGSVPRTLAAKAAEIISVRDFGAVGDGIRSDTPAIAAAVAHGSSTGQPIFVPKGTYVVDPASLLIKGSDNADRFVLYGEGASSILKARDGSITSANSYMLRFSTTQNMECIEVRDLVIDMNARGSPDPSIAKGDQWAFQHSHAIQIAARAGTIKRVCCSNVTIRDPAADGFNCSIVGTASVLSFIIDNCAVIDRARVRSDICFASLPVLAIVDGFYGEVIEVEAELAARSAVRLQFSNCHVNRLDFQSHYSDWTSGNVEVHLDNVTAPVRVDFLGVMLRASNCVFGISTDRKYRWWALQPGSQISDSLLLHEYDSGTNAVGSLQPMSSATYAWRTSLRLIGCESRIDASGAISPSGAAILGAPGVTPAMADNANLEVINHRFDSRFESSVVANQCGGVRLSGNSYGGTFAAVEYRSGTRTAVNLSVEGGDFARVRGASIATTAVPLDQETGIGHMSLSGDHVGVVTPWIGVSGNLPGEVYDQLHSNRRMLMRALPRSGIIGDIIELNAPPAGEVDSYRCTSAGPAATWKARTALAG